MIAPILLDIGNAIFFVVNFPQLRSAYQNRKDLKGLNPIMLLGVMIASILFGTAGIIMSAPFTVISCFTMVVANAVQFYWKWKYR